MVQIIDWFLDLPFFTRCWLGATVCVSLLAMFGIIPPELLTLEYSAVFKESEIWRPITALLYFPIGPGTILKFIISCCFLMDFSSALEDGDYQAVPARYAFLLFFNWVVSVAFGLCMNMKTLMYPMVLSVLYIWCNFNRHELVNTWFGPEFEAMYLPWVLLVLSKGGTAELLGIIIGQMYFFFILGIDFLVNYFTGRHGPGVAAGVAGGAVVVIGTAIGTGIFVGAVIGAVLGAFIGVFVGAGAAAAAPAAVAARAAAIGP